MVFPRRAASASILFRCFSVFFVLRSFPLGRALVPILHSVGWTTFSTLPQLRKPRREEPKRGALFRLWSFFVPIVLGDRIVFLLFPLWKPAKHRSFSLLMWFSVYPCRFSKTIAIFFGFWMSFFFSWNDVPIGFVYVSSLFLFSNLFCCCTYSS